MARGSKVEVKCRQCKVEFMARVADRKRGWAKFCSKSCKASNQEGRTGQYRAFIDGQDSEFCGCVGMDEESVQGSI